MMTKLARKPEFPGSFSGWEVELAASIFLQELNVDSLPLSEDLNAKLKTALSELEELGFPDAIIFCLETLSNPSLEFVSRIGE